MPQLIDTFEPDEQALLCGVGRLICAWGMIEVRFEQKVHDMRQSLGDVRTVGARTKPTMARLFTDLRTMVSMRDRRNAASLVEIAEIEREIQRIDRFRSLIVQGFNGMEADGFTCRDIKNNVVHISINQLREEVEKLEELGSRLLSF